MVPLSNACWLYIVAHIISTYHHYHQSSTLTKLEVKKPAARLGWSHRYSATQFSRIKHKRRRRIFDISTDVCTAKNIAKSFKLSVDLGGGLTSSMLSSSHDIMSVKIGRVRHMWKKNCPSRVVNPCYINMLTPEVYEEINDLSVHYCLSGNLKLSI